MKNASVIALVLLLSCLFISCENNGPDNDIIAQDTTNHRNSDKIPQILPALPECDFDAYEFNFLVREFYLGYWGSVEIYSESENGEPINDAVYRRNSYIEDKYNVKITETRSADIYNEAYTNILSGNDVYDAIMTDLLSSGYLASQGYLLDLKSIPYIDLSKPWYDQRANSQLSINNKLYMTVGDLNILDNEATWVIMFNKQVAADNKLGNLYDYVYKNEWTYDIFLEVIKNISRDVNGDGVYDEHDMWGVLADITEFPCISFLNTGEAFARKDNSDMPYISFNSDRAVSVLERVFDLMRNKSITLLASDLAARIANPWADGLNVIFKENRALFYCISLTVMNQMRDMNSDFGVLPYPKFDSSQNEYYHSIQAPCTSSITIPITSSDPERTGIILEAMSAESMYTLTPAYFDTTITNKTIRDEDSANMLDLIFKTRNYDLGYIYNWGDMLGLLTSLNLNAGKFSSAYERNETKINIDLEKTIEQFQNN